MKSAVPERHPSETRQTGYWSPVTILLVQGVFLLSHAGIAELTANDVPPPLHTRLDQLIEDAQLGSPAPLASDGEFLRRVYLDLTGRIPDTNTVRAFLADTSPSKRTEVVDRLLATPEHVRHLANVFDLMLMERRPAKHVTQAEWNQYLLDSFARQKPYHELVSELLSSDGTEAGLRGAARFVLDREVEPNLLTRDISRIFLGRDIQCSQCHDHPLIDDYYQAEYYGLYAFVGRSSLFVDAKNENKAYVAEKGEGDISYKSVFTEIEGESRPQLLNQAALDEPVLAPGDEYLVKPEKDVRPVPKYSRRTRLAEELARGDHPDFRRNLANRLWAWMMGRGLVEPVDLHHAKNTPQHAEVLDLLADELAEQDFNIRQILRELALTRSYQRSIEPEDNWLTQIELGTERLPVIEEALANSVEARKQAAEQHDNLRAEIKTQRAEIAPQRETYQETRRAEAIASFAAREAATSLETTRGTLAARQEVLTAVEAAVNAARQATEKLPDEADLAAATAQFVAKAEAIAAEVTKLAAMAEDQQKAKEATATTLVEAKQHLAEAEQRFHELAAPIQEREMELELLAEKLEKWQSQSQVIEQQAARIRNLHARQEILLQQVAAREQFEQLARTRTAVAEMASQLGRQLADQQEQITELKARLSEHSAKSVAQSRQLTSQVAAGELLEMALAQLAQAVAEVSDDKELSESERILAKQAERFRKSITSGEIELKRREQELTEIERARDAALTEAEDLANQQLVHQRKLAELDAEHVRLEEQYLEGKKSAVVAEQELEELWTQQLALASLKTLSPEQLAWSILEATGVIAVHRAAVEKELDEKPETAELDASGRATAIEAGVHAKLEPSVNQFISLFGAGAGQPQNDFFSTVDQALFFTNGGPIQSWLKPSGENLTQRLLRVEEPHEIADELYLTVLSRAPTAGEREWVAGSLASSPDSKSEIVQELAWALLTSAEFRFCP